MAPAAGRRSAAPAAVAAAVARAAARAAAGRAASAALASGRGFASVRGKEPPPAVQSHPTGGAEGEGWGERPRSHDGREAGGGRGARRGGCAGRRCARGGAVCGTEPGVGHVRDTSETRPRRLGCAAPNPAAGAPTSLPPLLRRVLPRLSRTAHIYLRPATCCMSCSDKLARWVALGLQGALLSALLPAPIVPASLTVGAPAADAAGAGGHGGGSDGARAALRRAVRRSAGPHHASPLSPAPSRPGGSTPPLPPSPPSPPLMKLTPPLRPPTRRFPPPARS